MPLPQSRLWHGLRGDVRGAAKQGAVKYRLNLERQQGLREFEREVVRRHAAVVAAAALML